MDYTTPKNIGGTTLIQNVLLVASKLHKFGKTLKNFFKALKEREIFNPNYPSMHPDKLGDIDNGHMNSTVKILKKINFESREVKTKFGESLKDLNDEYIKKEKEDDNPDSENKDRTMLLDIVKNIKDHLNGYISPTSNEPHLFLRYNSEYCVHTTTKMEAEETFFENLNTNIAEGQQTNGYDLDSMMVPMFHGVPLMQTQYSNSDRRFIRETIYSINWKLLNKIELSKEEKSFLSIHSRTAMASAGFQSLVDLYRADESQLENLNKIETALDTYLSTESNENSDTAIHSFAFKFKKFPTSIIWENLRPMSPPKSIVKYRAPILSTSKTCDHAIRYAIGRSVEKDKGESPMNPNYDKKGHPRQRIAGLLFVMWKSLPKVRCSLESGRIVDVNQKFSNVTDEFIRIQPQQELTFLGKIDSEDIICVIPIVWMDVPQKNEWDDEDLDFYKDIFGIDPNAYGNSISRPNKLIEALSKSPHPLPKVTGEKTKNEKRKSYHLPAVESFLYRSFSNLANGVLTARAKEENKMLVTFGQDHDLIPYKVKWYRSEEYSKAKQDIQKSPKFVDKSPLWKVQISGHDRNSTKELANPEESNPKHSSRVFSKDVRRRLSYKETDDVMSESGKVEIFGQALNQSNVEAISQGRQAEEDPGDTLTGAVGGIVEYREPHFENSYSSAKGSTENWQHYRETRKPNESFSDSIESDEDFIKNIRGGRPKPPKSDELRLNLARCQLSHQGTDDVTDDDKDESETLSFSNN